jgi:alpha-mannosidase
VGGVVAAGEAFTLPLTAWPAPPAGAGTRPAQAAVVAVDRPNVTVEAVKKADRKDAVVLRLCEAWGARGPVRLRMDRSVHTAVRTDVLERAIAALTIVDGQVGLDLHPFELVTLELAR